MNVPAIRILVVAACMVGATVYLSAASRDEIIPARVPLASMPMTIDGWAGKQDPDLTPEILAILGVDDYLSRTFIKADNALGLYIGFHESQRQGDTMHSPLNCLPGAGWIPTEQGRMSIPVQGAPGARGISPVEVNRVVIAKGLDRQLVLYWYQSHRRVVASEYMGKVYTVLDSVRYHRTDAALVRVVAPVGDGTLDAAEKRATAFVQSMFPLLTPHLPS